MLDIHEQIDELARIIKSHPCREELKEIEKRMENNEEVILLANDFNKAQREYSDGLKHYEEDSKEVKELFENLRKTKNILDSHPLVQEYYQKFQEVNEPLNYLQFNLLSLFNNKCE